MPVILVTGFGPFGEHKINASWEAVKLLPENVDGYTIIKQEIPVSYIYVEHKLPELWKIHNPKLVLHVGVSSFTSKIQLETCAYRKGYERSDCLGIVHPTGEVCCIGEDCITTGLSVENICQNVNKQNLPVDVCLSQNAGRYLCEFTYYTSLNIAKDKTLFVHVPPLDKPFSAQELSNGLLEIIKSSLNQDPKNSTSTVYKNGRAAAFY